jgi:hypothetical protein
MAIKLRIQIQDNQYISNSSSIQELLKVLLDVQNGALILTPDEDDSLRGWLLFHAQELNNGEIASLEGQHPPLSIGKTTDGRPFVRDARGDWPPLKPEFE